MSSLREFTESAGQQFLDLPVQDMLAVVGIVVLIAAFAILRWRFNVQSSRRLNAAIDAYVESQFSQYASDAA